MDSFLAYSFCFKCFDFFGFGKNWNQVLELKIIVRHTH